MEQMSIQEFYSTLNDKQRYDVFTALRGPDQNKRQRDAIKRDTTEVIRHRIANVVGIDGVGVPHRPADGVIILDPGYGFAADWAEWGHFYQHIIAAATALRIPVFKLNIDAWHARYGR